MNGCADLIHVDRAIDQALERDTPDTPEVVVGRHGRADDDLLRRVLVMASAEGRVVVGSLLAGVGAIADD